MQVKDMYVEMYEAFIIALEYLMSKDNWVSSIIWQRANSFDDYMMSK